MRFLCRNRIKTSAVMGRFCDISPLKIFLAKIQGAPIEIMLFQMAVALSGAFPTLGW